MKPAHLIVCSSLAIAGCGNTPIEVGMPPPPAEWLTCEKMPVAPDLKPLERIALPNGGFAYLVPETNARDAQIARYIVALRGAHFDCWNKLEQVRGYHAVKP